MRLSGYRCDCYPVAAFLKAVDLGAAETSVAHMLEVVVWAVPHRMHHCCHHFHEAANEALVADLTSWGSGNGSGCRDWNVWLGEGLKEVDSLCLCKVELHLTLRTEKCSSVREAACGRNEDTHGIHRTLASQALHLALAGLIFLVDLPEVDVFGCGVCR